MKKYFICVVWCFFGIGLFGMNRKNSIKNRAKRAKRVSRTGSFGRLFSGSRGDSKQTSRVRSGSFSFSCEGEGPRKISPLSDVLKRKVSLLSWRKRPQSVFVDLSNKTITMETLKKLPQEVTKLHLANTKIDESNGQIRPVKGQELAFLSKFKELRELNLAYASINEDDLEWLDKKIECLDLSYTSLEYGGLLCIVNTWPKIKTLILRGCCLLKTQPLEFLHDLKVVDFSDCQNLPDNVIEHILKGSEDVEEIHLNDCTYWHGESGEPKKLDHECLMPLMNCKKLKKLSLRNANLHHEHFLWFPKSIEELDVSGTGATSDNLVAITKCLPKLKKLVIKGYKPDDLDKVVLEVLRERNAEIITD